MTCKTIYNYMMKYFDRNINDLELSYLDNHIKVCGSCRLEFNNLKETISVFDEENVIFPPADFEKQVMVKVGKIDNLYQLKIEKTMFIIYCAVSILLGIFIDYVVIKFRQDVPLFLEMMGINSYIANVFYEGLEFLDEILIGIKGIFVNFSSIILDEKFIFSFIVLILFLQSQTYFLTKNKN